MNTLFDNLIESYMQLMEADDGLPSDADVGGTTDAQQPQNTPQGQQPEQQQPQQSEKASVGYAVMAQILLDAFKTTSILNKSDIKFSDNVARTPQDAYRYIEIIKRNLAPDLKAKIYQDVGKSTQVEDLDSADLIRLTNLAIKSLWFANKDVNSSEFSDIAKIDKVTTDNAKKIVNDIRRLIAER